MESNNYDNVISVKFAQAEQPVFCENKSKGYIEFGKDNNYPQYLIDLYKESPKHGAIVKGKITYIYGGGFDTVKVNANTKGQSWDTILKKCIGDDERFAGFYLQVIYNMLGKIKDVYHIDFKKVRTNKAQTIFYVKDDWKDNKETARKYPAFNNKYEKDQPSKILFVKQDNPDSDVYPLPNYFQGLNYIDSDVQVSRHILGNAKEGFVASTLINLNGGEPGEEAKAATEKGLKKKFTGSEGDRVVIMFNKSKDNAADIQSLSNTMLTKEDFTNINNLISQEIFTCHQITSPMLFGIKTEGQLGGRTELQDAYEIFKNTYVNERQQTHEETFNSLFKVIGIPEQKIKPVEPLGFALSEDNLLTILPREYFLDKLGVDQKYYVMAPAGGQVAGQNDPSGDVSGTLSINKNLAGMTGRNFQQLERIIRKYKKGTMNRSQAALMLKSSFGLSDEDISVMLDADSSDQKFATQDELDFALIEQFSTVGESIDDFEILSTKSERGSQYFADVKELTELEANVLNLVKKDKRVTSEVIAKVLKQDVPVIDKVLSNLETAGVLKTTTQNNTIEREATGIDIKGPKPTTTDILLRYRYDWRTDISAAEKATGKPGSRPFCQKLMDLNRVYSRADIELISERLGYSVWDRCGGWWTREDGTHDPKCRHEWFALTVIRKS